MAKKRVNITITEETKERILQYAYENHLQGGLSGAIEHIAVSYTHLDVYKRQSISHGRC